MRPQGAAVQAGLAAVALTAAYFAWQKEPERAAEEVVVVDARPAELEGVRFEDATKWVELRRADDLVWVRHGTKARPPAQAPEGGADGGVGLADAGAAAPPDAGMGRPAARDAGTPAAAPTTVVDRELKGSEQARALLERFAPLRGTRGLGVLSPEKLRELGLADTPRRLELTLSGGPRAFKVSSVNALLTSPYVLDERDGRVYLVGATQISDLEAASTRLVDRRLHTFPQVDYDLAVVKVGGKERAFTQSGDGPQNLRVAPRDAPDKPDEFARNWLQRVWGFVPTELLGRGEEPFGGAPTVEGRVEYSRGAKPLGFVELARGHQNYLYVRTEHTAGWVRVQIGAVEVLQDGKKIAGE